MPHKTKENIYFMPISLGGSDGKESACDARDPGSIPGLGRSLADLAMGRGACWATVHGDTKSWTQLSD